jgi:ribosomal protein S18 acetylase RimI-like enzyme
MSDSLIRRATACDLPAIIRLLAELISSVLSVEGVEVGSVLKTCEELLRDNNHHMLVAETNRGPVRFISFSTRRTLLHRSPSGLIDELVVAREHRGEGIGKELVLAAIEECRRLGCCELEVSTEKTNAGAREFYRTCGFEERGVLLEADL